MDSIFLCVKIEILKAKNSEVEEHLFLHRCNLSV